MSGGLRWFRLEAKYPFMSTKFVTNAKGKKVAALIPIKEYEDLLQDNYSAAIIERRKAEKTYPWQDLKKKLIEDGILSH